MFASCFHSVMCYFCQFVPNVFSFLVALSYVPIGGRAAIGGQQASSVKGPMADVTVQLMCLNWVELNGEQTGLGWVKGIF